MVGVSAHDIDGMPLDVLFRVLLRLPVASLCRLKQVCKSWQSLIESSNFIYQHLDFSSSKESNCRFTVLSPPDASNRQQISSVTDADCELFDLPSINVPYQFLMVKLVGSCNGVICLRQGRGICLWNPATKQCTYVTLPVVPLKLIIGFGFDVKTNDYKLLCINMGSHYSSHVYSSHSDYWRTINVCVLDCMRIRMDPKTPFRGGIYCMLCVHDNDWNPRTIITFDFSNEEFRAIGVPSSLTNILSIFMLRNNISCINEVKNEMDWLDGPQDGHWLENPQDLHFEMESPQDRHFEIWMLSDYNDDESWTKVYSVEHFVVNFQYMTGFSKNGDFLLFVKDACLCLYDLITGEVMDLPVEVNHDVEVVVCSQSLVSIKRGNSRIVVDQNGRMLINQSMATNNTWCGLDIPVTVMFHILLRLPVISLLRFKSVCKAWYALIKSFYFVTQHLHHHHQNGKKDINLILYSLDGYSQLYENSSHPSLKTSPACLLSSDKFELLDLPYHEDGRHKPLTIVTSFNGVICLLRRESNHVFLWNPATKQFRVVLIQLEPDIHLSWVDIEYFGFGFDVKTKDYKLIRIWFGKNIYSRGGTNIAQVYDLSTDSWRTIEDEILPTLAGMSQDGSLQAPYRNETYCWLIDVDGTSKILSFHFGDEVFGTLPLPDDFCKFYQLNLAILHENIACIYTNKEFSWRDAKDWQCEIWMMSEYGVKESWTKLYTVGPFPKTWCMLMGFSMQNTDYILLGDEDQVYSYDLVIQETKRCDLVIQETKRLSRRVQRIHGPTYKDLDWHPNFMVALYEESLVPIKGGFAGCFK